MHSARVADFVTVVPGVRLAATTAHDQAASARRTQVAAAGADVLVVGRAVTAADDPRRGRERVHDGVRTALIAG